VLQVAPVWQVVPQQGWPTPPQAPHVPPEQTNPVAQASPAQQSCVLPPQAAQVSLAPHRFPAAQVEPPQQGWPGPPHVPQVPAVEQVTPVEHCRLAQQSWPALPQGAQVPTEHTASPEQRSPEQQDWPAMPQLSAPSPAVPSAAVSAVTFTSDITGRSRALASPAPPAAPSTLEI
jgi:hypothetical protein